MYPVMEYTVVVALILALAAFTFLVFVVVLATQALGRTLLSLGRLAYEHILHAATLLLKFTRGLTVPDTGRTH